ncbi:hypothetical protein [Hydrogenimonas sp.]|uniref:hypothetical protein n=1 Tax=Hydrogenimonas sp. TaxID=2231112 RepID=UPI00263415EA|nr:hypothetical protein [Hydrogenimonas sp.]
MRLETVLAVTGGRLLNTPFISGFETVATKLKKVHRGSLFFAKEREDAEEAVKLGAYGIITDLSIPATDQEIAWIHVDSLAETLPKLLRLWLVENPRKIRYVPASTLEFIRELNYDHGVLPLENDDGKRSEQLFDSSPLQTILCDDIPFIEHIGYLLETADSDPVEYSVVSESIFETSIILEGHYHRRLPLASCMLSSFMNAVGVLKHLSAGFTLQHLRHTPSFQPVFVNRHGEKIPFGASEHVLIFADNFDNCRCFRVLDDVRWIERKVFIPTQIKFECDIKTPIYQYDSLKSLLSIIRKDFSKPAYTIIAGLKEEIFFEKIQRERISSETTIFKGFDFNA